MRLAYLAAGLLIGLAVTSTPVREQTVSELNIKNLEWFRATHVYWLTVGDGPNPDRWEIDVIAAYDSVLAEYDGTVVDWDVPDIRARWQAGYYEEAK